MKVAAGFMAAKHLFAASELGLFEALADAPAALEALAGRAGLTPRAARISADAMVALGLLERHGDTYHNSPTADRFLAGRPQPDLRPLLRFWDRVSYPAWQDLAGSLGRGPRQEIFDLDDELQEIASAGIEAVLAGPAAALAHTYDFGARRRLLDVGGGTGRGRSPRCRPIRASLPLSSSCRWSRPWPRPGSPRPGSATGSRSSPAT